MKCVNRINFTFKNCSYTKNLIVFIAHIIILLNNTSLNNQQVTNSLPFSTYIGLFGVLKFTMSVSGLCVDYSVFLDSLLLDILIVSFLTFFYSLLNLSKRTSLTNTFKKALSDISAHPLTLSFFKRIITWHIICRGVCVCVISPQQNIMPTNSRALTVLFAVSLEQCLAYCRH